MSPVTSGEEPHQGTLLARALPALPGCPLPAGTGRLLVACVTDASSSDPCACLALACAQTGRATACRVRVSEEAGVVRLVPVGGWLAVSPRCSLPLAALAAAPGGQLLAASQSSLYLLSCKQGGAAASADRAAAPARAPPIAAGPADAHSMSVTLHTPPWVLPRAAFQVHLSPTQQGGVPPFPLLLRLFPAAGLPKSQIATLKVSAEDWQRGHVTWPADKAPQRFGEWACRRTCGYCTFPTYPGLVTGVYELRCGPAKPATEYTGRSAPIAVMPGKSRAARRACFHWGHALTATHSASHWCDDCPARRPRAARMALRGAGLDGRLRAAGRAVARCVQRRRHAVSSAASAAAAVNISAMSGCRHTSGGRVAASGGG